jgi:hypothetical protein
VPVVIDLGPGEAEVLAFGFAAPGALLLLEDGRARSIASRVTSGTPWTTLVAAMISSAGSPRKSGPRMARQTSRVRDQVWMRRRQGQRRRPRRIYTSILGATESPGGHEHETGAAPPDGELGRELSLGRPSPIRRSAAASAKVAGSVGPRPRGGRGAPG